MIDKLKALNKKTIALIAVTAVVLVAGIVGAVTFLKDDGTTAATELQGDGSYNGENLPVAGNDVAVDVVEDNQEQEEPSDDSEEPDADTATDTEDTDEDETPAGTTGAGTAGTGTGAGTTGGTTYQEFVTEETYWVTEDGLRVGWSPIRINSKYTTLELGINKPGLKVTKTADKTENVKAGETVVYTIEVENIGQIAVKDVVLADVLTKTASNGTEISDELDIYNTSEYNEEGPTGVVVEKIDVVEVGQKVQVFAFYTVTQDDIENEVVLTNSAVAENGPTKGEDDEPVKVEERNPVLDVTKVANENVTEIENGKSVTYTVTVENKGNVELTTTLTDTLVLTKVDKTTEELNVTDKLVDENGETLVNPIVLEVGAKKVYTYTYTDSVEDITVDTITNKLSYETETRKDDEEVKEPEKEPEVVVDVKNPEITVEKTVENEKEEYKLGDTITYVVTVSNTGEIDIENINVEDTLKSNENNTLVDLGRTATLTEGTATIEKLAVGASATLKYTYTVVEADLGKTIVNTVVAKGGNTEGGDETPGEDVEKRKPSVDITKVAESATIENGQTVNYTVTVVNTGNVTVKVTLSDVITKLDKDGKTLGTVNPELKDKDTGAVLNGEVSLEPGATKVYVYSYTDDSNEIEVNKITNKITSNVTTDTPDEEVEKPEDPTVEVEVKNPAIEVSKVADKTENVKADELITYTITVKNTSEVEVKDLTIADTLTKLENNEVSVETLTLDLYDSAEYDNGAKGNKVTKIDSLKAGEEVKLYAFYKVTLSDVENQYTIANSVVAKNGPTEGGDEEKVDVDDRKPGVEVTKVANTASIDNGGVVNYEVTVKNTGNVEVKVTLSDVITKMNGKEVVATETPEMVEKGTTNVLNGEITLAPGEEKVYVYSYTDNREDLSVNKVTNKVTANVTTNDPEEVVDPEDPTVEVEVKNPDVTVTKVAENKKAKYVLGDVVVYNVTITNSGKTVLTNVTPADAMEGIELVKVTLNGEELADKPASIATMNVGDVAVYTYNYTVKESDLGKGEISNKVVVTTNETPTPDEDEEIIVVDGRNPNVEITKTSNVSVIDNGSTVNYEVKVKNTGNVKVYVTLSDVLTKLDKDGNALGTVNVELKDKETNETLTGSVELAVGEEKVYVYSYTDDSSDITVEKVTNKVTSTVTTENEEDPEVTPQEPTVNVEINNPSVTVEKEVTSKGTGEKGAYKLGETITYKVTVKNNGEIALTGVKVADVLKEKSGETLVDFVGNATTTDEETFDLAIGTEKVLTYTYTVVEADLGKTLVNTVNVKADNTEDGDETPGEKVEEKNPGLNVTKVADATTIDNKGTVTYTVTVENTGNTTLTVNLADAITKLDKDGNQIGDKVTIEGIQSPVTLAPYATTTVKYTYTDGEETEVEVIRNNITATTDDPAVGDSDTIDVAVNNPSVDVEKTVENAKSEYALNDVITYVVKVTNNGELDLSNVTVEDILKEKVGEEVVTFTKQATLAEKTENVKVENDVTTIISLPKDATETIKYTYTIVEEDLGKTLINTVTAKGKDTEGGDETPGEKVEDKKPGLNVTKVADATTIDNKGTVTYTVTVENTGNTTLTVNLADVITKLDKDGNQIGDKVAIEGIQSPITLAPYATTTLTYTYTDGEETEVELIRNELKATTDVPEVKDDSTVDVNVNNPSVNVEKEVTSKGTGENGAYKLGETITYKVTVTNNGEIALTGVKVADVLKEKSGETLVDFVGNATTTDEETFDLAVGAEKVLTYTYTITEADLGKTLVNTVKATGEDTEGGDETPGEKVEDKKPGLEVTKTSDKTTIDNTETITYTVTVTNTGNTTLTVKLADEITKLNENLEQVGEKVAVTELPETVTLVPNETKTYTYTYTDEAETEVEVIRNNITATTDLPEVKDDSTVDVNVNNPSVKVEKNVTSTGTGDNGTYKLGEKITYEVTITNDGETVLENMVVADVLKEKDTNGNLTTLANQATLVSGNETIEKLAIEGSVTLTYEYTITEADLGKTLVNTVAASGSNTEGGDETPGEKVEEKNPSLTVEKTVSKNGGDYSETVTVGYNDTVKYKMVVTNNGNLTLNVTETDVLTTNKVDGTKPTTDVVVVNEDGTEFTSVELAPNGSVTLYYDYGTIDQDKVNTINTMDNTITVNSVNPADNTQTATDNDNATVTVLKPNITATKASSIMDGDKVVKSSPMTVKPGDVITYTITVTNNGDTNGNATVVDEIPAGVTLLGTPVVSDTTYTAMTVEGKTITVVATSMPADASFTITFTAQVDAINNDVAQTGLQIVNNVKVDGSITDTTTDTVSKPVITAVKTSEYTTTAVTTDSTSTTKNVHEGDTIVYTMTIKNLGLVKSEVLTFEDILPDGVEYVSSTGKVISWGTNASGSFENEVKDLSSTTSVNAEGKTVVAWDSTELDRGQKAVLTVTVRVKALEAGVYSANITNNTVTVKQNNIPVVEGEDPKDYDVVKSNIAVSKAVKSEDETKDLNGVAVRTGTTVKYIITATNAGATEAETVTITDNLDTTALRNISATVSVNGGDATALDVTDGNISYTTTINPNDTVVIKVTATTRTLNDGETSYRVNNTADFTYDGNSGSSNTVTTEAKHLLEISKTVTTPTLTNTAEYGDKITYTITAKNLSGVAEPVTIVDEISDYLSDVRNIKVNGVENSSIYNSTTHTITYNGTLANLNDTVTITFDATVNTIEVGKVIENTAYVNDVPAEAPDVKVIKEVAVTVDALTQNPLDIILVIDRSGSMTSSSSKRFVNAKAAANAVVDILFPEAIDTGSTISVISFAEDVTTNIKAYKGTQKEAIKTTIGTTNDNGLTADGGTNIYGALSAVNTLLDSGSLTNTKKLVIFLSDGAPVTTSTYNDTVDNILNTNNSNGGSSFNGNTRTEIEEMAAKIKAHSNTTVHSVGLSVNSTDMNNTTSRAWAELCNEVSSSTDETDTSAINVETSSSNNGDNYTFTITLTNSSDTDVTLDNFVVTTERIKRDTISYSPNENASRNENKITWKELTVPANGTVTLTVSGNKSDRGGQENPSISTAINSTSNNNNNNNVTIGGTCTNEAHKVSPFTDKFSGTLTKNGKVYHYMTTYKFADYILSKIASDSSKYHSNIGDSNLDQLTTVFENIIRENISNTNRYYTEELPAVINIPETATIIGNITVGLDGTESEYTKAELTAGITGEGYTLTYTAGTGFVWTITSNDVLYKELTIQYAK